MNSPHQIGKFRVHREGGQWLVSYQTMIISRHEAKWQAIKRARLESWHAHAHKKPPAKADTEAGGLD